MNLAPVRTALIIFFFVPIFNVYFAAADDKNKKDIDPTSPLVTAMKVEAAPVLDGEVLNDAVWQAAKAVTGFWQTTPSQGQAASEKTEVRILYTNRTLYFGVVCYDRDPKGIIVSDSRRDASLEETDSFQLILDTYHDKQNGFLFGTNPAAIEYDAQVTNEGSGRFGGGRQQRGAVRFLSTYLSNQICHGIPLSYLVTLHHQDGHYANY